MTRELLPALHDGTPEFDARLTTLSRRGESDLERVEPAVREILSRVRGEGDAAVLDFVRRFEGRAPAQLYVTEYGGEAALSSLSPDVAQALRHAAERITRYHRRQCEQLVSFEYEEDGVWLGSRITPLERVAVYAPGGKARYPSSVLMSAIPARVAGAHHVVVASPDPGPEVRAACFLAGVDAVLDAGGAQAIAALAYGTETVPRVDKIVDPDNIYVAAAKRLVFGDVDIDSIAGPSEILVIADDSADAAVLAADLLSQAEHDEAAYALLLTTEKELPARVAAALSAQLESLPRRAVAEASLLQNGAALVVASRARLAQVANQLAAEHVALHVAAARELAAQIRAAGALFVGPSTPEAAGDYLAGPSHVLPTGGAARYAAPLGVYDFVSRSSVIEYTPAALAAQGPEIEALARCEGLEAHARSVAIRRGRS